MQYHVYIIGKNIQEDPPYLNCYVGVTNDPKRRWYLHSKSDYTVGTYIRSNSLTYEDHMHIVFSGSKEDCFAQEEALRPTPFIGLNEAAGGQGGYTIYSTDRNQKISKALKGREMTWGDKVSSTRLERGSGRGSLNPRAKRWQLISPQGEVYNVQGTIQSKCKELEIMWSCLNKYKNQAVPPIQVGGYGGFRALNEDHYTLRQNTVGWTLIEEN